MFSLLNSIHRSQQPVFNNQNIQNTRVDLPRENNENGINFFFNLFRKAFGDCVDVTKATSVKGRSLPKISVEQLDKILIRKGFGGKTELAKILKEHGFSSVIQGQTFPETFSFANLNVEGVEFDQCIFTQVPFSKSILKNVVFKKCDFTYSSFAKSSLTNCKFENCTLKEAGFVGSRLENVRFTNTNIEDGSFEDTKLLQCTFIKCELPRTHFLEATVNKCKILKSNLRDTVFFKTLERFHTDKESRATAVVSRPTTVILVNPEVPGSSVYKAYKKLITNAETIPIRVAKESEDANLYKVNVEMKGFFESLSGKENKPIPQTLMEDIRLNPAHERFKILKKAEKLAEEVDSFFLPGGMEDVPPTLYGQKVAYETDWGDDYRRSLLELSLIHQAHNKGIPLMAVCRGFQITNVYFGAQLIQDIKGHWDKVQRFELIEGSKHGLYGNVMQKPIRSVCYHHQAVALAEAPKEHIVPSVVSQSLSDPKEIKIVKASEPKTSGSSPMLLLQFHPEYYRSNNGMSKENEGFWDILGDSAKAYRTKRVTLEQFKRNVK